MRPGIARLGILASLLGFAGCSEPAQELPPEYGEQQLTPKAQGKPKPPPIPSGMEPAESRSARPGP